MRRGLLGLSGCGILLLTTADCGDGANEPATNPAPVLLGAVPAQLVVGSGATSVTLTGSGFVTQSRARWNGEDRGTHYQNAQTLIVDLLASDVADTLAGSLTVFNAAPGGGISDALTVPVGYPVPRITSLTPDTISTLPSVSLFRLTITGTGFVPQSRVVVASIPRVVVSEVTPTQIIASVPTAELGGPRPLDVTVFNPPPGGGLSNVLVFNIIYRVPTIVALSPDSGVTGSAFTLTVTGTEFYPEFLQKSSVVRWNGSDRPTTWVDNRHIMAAISASDVSVPGVAMVTVHNPTPGGGTSNAVPFRIRAPTPVINAIILDAIAVGSGRRLSHSPAPIFIPAPPRSGTARTVVRPFSAIPR